AIGDQHDLVGRLDQRDPDHRTVALAGVDQDDALAAAVLTAEFLELGALAVAARAHRQHPFALRLGASQAHDLVAFAELDRLHARSVAAHGAHLRLVEADRLPGLGRDQEFGVAVRDAGREQLIALLDAHADDALVAVVLVLHQRGLLDLSAARDGG